MENLANIRLQKTVEHGITETARPASNHERLAIENGHDLILVGTYNLFTIKI